MIRITAVLVLALNMMGCREESDQMLSYAFNENIAFQKAETSYAEKFKVFWLGMNTNYSLWDYEQTLGLDWDAHYDEYLPRYEALDEAGREVTDDELRELLEQTVAPLHDGHLLVRMKNHLTGNYVSASPARLRNQQRADYDFSQNFVPRLDYYAAAGQLLSQQSSSTRTEVHFDTFMNREGQGMSWVGARMEALGQQASLTSDQQREYQDLQTLTADVAQWRLLSDKKERLATYNKMALRYAWLHIPGFDEIPECFATLGMTASYALFADGIAYLYISDFYLSPYLSKVFRKLVTSTVDEEAEQQMEPVRKVWLAWFQTIQQLHADGQLKGVVIDLRSNKGGYANDFQYVLGSLLPAGGIDYARVRFKRGTGRYDYSPLLPQVANAYGGEHREVTDVPIVVLVNGMSASMCETTALCVKLTNNAYLVGQRTYGALCSLADNTDYSDNYAGYVGIEGVTPVYCYIPGQALFTLDGEVLESVGISPDIDVALDADDWQASGRDSQLDRALLFIRTGQ